MTHDVSVRRAEPDDVDGMWPLVRDFATSFVPVRDTFATSLSELLDRGDSLVLVATEGPEIVGYLLASTHGTFFANGDVAWIEEVWVDATRRRRGIGRLLMVEAERWATDLGVAYISLATRRASAFYVALGYEESATFFKRTLER